jgi:hypothetical protein
MSFVQYTKCVAAGSKKYPSWAPNPVTTLVLASIPVLLATLAVPHLAAIEVPLLIAYCLWWLYDRLICLGGDVCAIGLLGVVEPPSEKSGFDKFDTDYSINLVLAPHNIQELPAGYPADVPPPDPLEDAKEYYTEQFKKALHRQIADDGIQGHLIKEQSVTKDDGWGFLGSFNKVVGSSVVHTYQPYLHCEFEGGGIYKFLQALYVLLPVATAAAIICSIPIIGWAVCAILGAVALVIAIAGVVAALNDTGSPSVVDPTGQTSDVLHPGSDILFVSGTWVYDSAHEGWNEIHPIKKCLRLGTVRYIANDVIDWDDAIANFMVAAGRWHFELIDAERRQLVKDSGPATPQDFRDWVKSTCDGVGRASSPVTVDNQRRPEHKWTIHPVIDGCRPENDDNGDGGNDGIH